MSHKSTEATETSAYSPSETKNFGTSGQKLRKMRYQSFLVMSKMT